MVDGQAGLNLVAALNHVVLEIKNMLDHVTTPSLLMVVLHVQDQLQKQRNVIHTTVQYMVDGQVGLNMVAVLNHVELETRSMSDLAQVQNQHMEANNVQVQQLKLKNVS